MAGDPQVWNQTEFGLLEKGRFKWEVFGTIRISDHLTDAYDNRVGTAVRLAATPRVGMLVGYLRRLVDPLDEGFRQENRFFVGPAFRLLLQPVVLEAVPSYERHFGIPGVASFNRYKIALDVETSGKRVAPFLFQHLTFLNDGLAPVAHFCRNPLAS